jgi:hypothetical protein
MVCDSEHNYKRSTARHGELSPSIKAHAPSSTVRSKHANICARLWRSEALSVCAAQIVNTRQLLESGIFWILETQHSYTTRTTGKVAGREEETRRAEEKTV